MLYFKSKTIQINGSNKIQNSPNNVQSKKPSKAKVLPGNLNLVLPGNIKHIHRKGGCEGVLNFKQMKALTTVRHMSRAVSGVTVEWVT